jgi:transcriptional regulator with XRE-family HTH domain
MDRDYHVRNSRQQKFITFVKIKDRLENWLESPGNTQTALAEGTGISQGAINNYLKGRIPKTDELAKLADFFLCSIDELLGRGEMALREEPPPYRVAAPAPKKNLVSKLRIQVRELEGQIAEIKVTLDQLEK